eukprot:gene19723-5709_t
MSLVDTPAPGTLHGAFAAAASASIFALIAATTLGCCDETSVASVGKVDVAAAAAHSTPPIAVGRPAVARCAALSAAV